MKVGFLGIQCDNPNLGVAALGYSVIRIVHELVPGEADFIVFSNDSPAGLEKMREILGLANKRVSALPFQHKNPKALLNSLQQMRTCDVIIDLTGGDSFSDIYGMRRLVLKLFDKQLALLSGTPLVIAPQTIGPFKSRIIMPWVSHVLNRAARVFTRDELSRQSIAGLTKRDITVTTDVAVRLPWDENRLRGPSAKPRIALNVSGLLWNGGYTQDNQFGLRADYRAYCDEVAGQLLEAGYEVHLLAHVIARGEDIREDDAAACRQLLQMHPDCQLVQSFGSPVEAKSVIAGMDALIGARMHATIAAFTTGVATVPVAYSRKFAGFFKNLGYDYLVDLTELDALEAASLTVAYVQDRDRLQVAAKAGNDRAQSMIATFTNGLAELL
jgi:colanic acid/amylovoran biosynthesis protein